MPFLKEGSIPNILKKNQETILKLGIPIEETSPLNSGSATLIPVSNMAMFRVEIVGVLDIDRLTQALSS